MLAFFRNDMGFGGNNGLTDFKDILGFPIQAAATRAALFSVTAIALMLAYVYCKPTGATWDNAKPGLPTMLATGTSTSLNVSCANPAERNPIKS